MKSNEHWKDLNQLAKTDKGIQRMIKNYGRENIKFWGWSPFFPNTSFGEEDPVSSHDFNLIMSGFYPHRAIKTDLGMALIGDSDGMDQLVVHVIGSNAIHCVFEIYYFDGHFDEVGRYSNASN